MISKSSIFLPIIFLSIPSSYGTSAFQVFPKPKLHTYTKEAQTQTNIVPLYRTNLPRRRNKHPNPPPKTPRRKHRNIPHRPSRMRNRLRRHLPIRPSRPLANRRRMVPRRLTRDLHHGPYFRSSFESRHYHRHETLSSLRSHGANIFMGDGREILYRTAGRCDNGGRCEFKFVLGEYQDV